MTRTYLMTAGIACLFLLIACGGGGGVSPSGYIEPQGEKAKAEGEEPIISAPFIGPGTVLPNGDVIQAGHTTPHSGGITLDPTETQIYNFCIAHPELIDSTWCAGILTTVCDVNENLQDPLCNLNSRYDDARTAHCSADNTVQGCPGYPPQNNRDPRPVLTVTPNVVDFARWWTATATGHLAVIRPTTPTDTTAPQGEGPRTNQFLQANTTALLGGDTIATDPNQQGGSLRFDAAEYRGAVLTDAAGATGGFAFYRADGGGEHRYAGILSDTTLGAPLSDSSLNGTWTGALFLGRGGGLGGAAGATPVDVTLTISYDSSDNTGEIDGYAAIWPPRHNILIDGTFNANGIISGTVRGADFSIAAQPTRAGIRSTALADIEKARRLGLTPPQTPDDRTGVLSGIIGVNGAVGVFYSTDANSGTGTGFSGGFVATSPCGGGGSEVACELATVNYQDWLEVEAPAASPNTGTRANQFLAGDADGFASPDDPATFARDDLIWSVNMQDARYNGVALTNITETNGFAFYYASDSTGGNARYATIFSGTDLGAPLSASSDLTAAWTGAMAMTRGNDGNGVIPGQTDDTAGTETYDMTLNVAFDERNGILGTVSSFVVLGGTEWRFRLDGAFDTRGVISGTTLMADFENGNQDTPRSNQKDGGNNHSIGFLSGIIGQNGAVGVFRSILDPGSNERHYAGGFVAAPPRYVDEPTDGVVDHALWWTNTPTAVSAPTTPDSVPSGDRRNQFLRGGAGGLANSADVTTNGRTGGDTSGPDNDVARTELVTLDFAGAQYDNADLFTNGSADNGIGFYYARNVGAARYATIFSGANLGAPISNDDYNTEWNAVSYMTRGDDGGATKDDRFLRLRDLYGQHEFKLEVNYAQNGENTVDAFIEMRVDQPSDFHLLIDGTFDDRGVITGTTTLGDFTNRTPENPTGTPVGTQANGMNNHSEGVLSGLIGQGGALGVFHSTLTREGDRGYAGGFVAAPKLAAPSGCDPMLPFTSTGCNDTQKRVACGTDGQTYTLDGDSTRCGMLIARVCGGDEGFAATTPAAATPALFTDMNYCGAGYADDRRDACLANYSIHGNCASNSDFETACQMQDGVKDNPGCNALGTFTSACMSDPFQYDGCAHITNGATLRSDRITLCTMTDPWHASCVTDHDEYMAARDTRRTEVCLASEGPATLGGAAVWNVGCGNHGTVSTDCIAAPFAHRGCANFGNIFNTYVTDWCAIGGNTSGDHGTCPTGTVASGEAKSYDFITNYVTLNAGERALELGTDVAEANAATYTLELGSDTNEDDNLNGYAVASAVIGGNHKLYVGLFDTTTLANLGTAVTTLPAADADANVDWSGKVSGLVLWPAGSPTPATTTYHPFSNDITLTFSFASSTASFDSGDTPLTFSTDSSLNRNLRLAGTYVASTGAITGTTVTLATGTSTKTGLLTGFIGENGAVGVFRSREIPADDQPGGSALRFVGGFAVKPAEEMSIPDPQPSANADYHDWWQLTTTAVRTPNSTRKNEFLHGGVAGLEDDTDRAANSRDIGGTPRALSTLNFDAAEYDGSPLFATGNTYKSAANGIGFYYTHDNGNARYATIFRNTNLGAPLTTTSNLDGLWKGSFYLSRGNSASTGTSLNFERNHDLLGPHDFILTVAFGGRGLEAGKVGKVSAFVPLFAPNFPRFNLRIRAQFDDRGYISGRILGADFGADNETDSARILPDNDDPNSQDYSEGDITGLIGVGGALGVFISDDRTGGTNSNDKGYAGGFVAAPPSAPTPPTDGARVATPGNDNALVQEGSSSNPYQAWLYLVAPRDELAEARPTSGLGITLLSAEANSTSYFRTGLFSTGANVLPGLGGETGAGAKVTWTGRVAVLRGANTFSATYADATQGIFDTAFNLCVNLDDREFSSHPSGTDCMGASTTAGENVIDNTGPDFTLRFAGKWADDTGVISGTATANAGPIATIEGFIGANGALGAFATPNAADVASTDVHLAGGFVAAPVPGNPASGMANYAAWLAATPASEAARISRAPSANRRNQFLQGTANDTPHKDGGSVTRDSFGGRQTLRRDSNSANTAAYNDGVFFYGLSGGSYARYATILSDTDVGTPISNENFDAEWDGKLNMTRGGSSNLFPNGRAFKLKVNYNPDGDNTVNVFTRLGAEMDSTWYFRMIATFDDRGVISGDILIADFTEQDELRPEGSQGDRPTDGAPNTGTDHSEGVVSGLIGEGGAVGVFISKLARNDAKGYAGGFVADAMMATTPPPPPPPPPPAGVTYDAWTGAFADGGIYNNATTGLHSGAPLTAPASLSMTDGAHFATTATDNTIDTTTTAGSNRATRWLTLTPAADGTDGSVSALLETRPTATGLDGVALLGDITGTTAYFATGILSGTNLGGLPTQPPADGYWDGRISVLQGSDSFSASNVYDAPFRMCLDVTARQFVGQNSALACNATTPSVTPAGGGVIPIAPPFIIRGFKGGWNEAGVIDSSNGAGIIFGSAATGMPAGTVTGLVGAEGAVGVFYNTAGNFHYVGGFVAAAPAPVIRTAAHWADNAFIDDDDDGMADAGEEITPLTPATIPARIDGTRSTRFVNGFALSGTNLDTSALTLANFNTTNDLSGVLTLADERIGDTGMGSTSGVGFVSLGSNRFATDVYAGVLNGSSVGTPVTRRAGTVGWSAKLALALGGAAATNYDVRLTVDYENKTINSVNADIAGRSDETLIGVRLGTTDTYFNINGGYTDDGIIYGTVVYTREGTSDGTLTGLIGAGDGGSTHADYRAIGAFKSNLVQEGTSRFTGGFVAAAPEYGTYNAWANGANVLVSNQDSIPPFIRSVGANFIQGTATNLGDDITDNLTPLNLNSLGVSGATGAITLGSVTRSQDGQNLDMMFTQYYAGLLNITNVGDAVTQAFLGGASVTWKGKLRVLAVDGAIGATDEDFTMNVNFGTKTISNASNTFGSHSFSFNGTWDEDTGVVTGSSNFDASGSTAAQTGVMRGLIGQGGAVGVFRSEDDATVNPFVGGFVAHKNAQ